MSSEECRPWAHKWVEKTNRYNQTYNECTKCGKVQG